MGRTDQALRHAEHQRERRRLRGSAGPREITIEHLSGASRGSRRRFRQHSVMIGRGEDNDVAFDAFDEPTVSAHHAEIRVEGEQFVLYDMGSLNGCYVGAQRVRRTPLEDGYEIGLGRSGPRVRIEIGRGRARRADGEASGTEVARKVDPDLPETGEVQAIGHGAFNRFESGALIAVLIAVLVDAAISLMRLG